MPPIFARVHVGASRSDAWARRPWHFHVSRASRSRAEGAPPVICAARRAVRDVRIRGRTQSATAVAGTRGTTAANGPRPVLRLAEDRDPAEDDDSGRPIIDYRERAPALARRPGRSPSQLTERTNAIRRRAFAADRNRPSPAAASVHQESAAVE